MIVEYHGMRWLTTDRLEKLGFELRKQAGPIHAVFVREGIEGAVDLRPDLPGIEARDVTIE